MCTTSSAGQPAADKIRSLLPDGFQPKVGMVLGSGMGGIADAIENPTIIPYGDIPGYPQSTVTGHSGQLVCGSLQGVDVVCFQGRVHLYEGIDPMNLRAPIYSLKLLGCEAFLVTTAVGSCRPNVGPGELVAITDHINLQGRNPLIGPNDPIGDRFISMLDAYDPAIRAAAHKHADDNEITLHDGTYLAVLGPSFETPAEIKAFTTLGADVVGMSTVAEVTLARHCGLRTFAMAVVVNLAAGLSDNHINHDETLHFTGLAAGKVTTLFNSLLADKSWQNW